MTCPLKENRGKQQHGHYKCGTWRFKQTNQGTASSGVIWIICTARANKRSVPATDFSFLVWKEEKISQSTNSCIEVIRVGVTWANKTHLKIGILSRKNGITVAATETHLSRNRVHLIKHPQLDRYMGGGGGGGIMSSPSYTLTPPLTSAGAFFKPHHRPLVYQPSTAAQNNRNRAAVVPRWKGFYWISLHRRQACDSGVYKTQICLLKMTQSTRLYGAVSTFNDRGVFALAEDGADGEQDGGGTCDWQYTKGQTKTCRIWS